MRPRSRARSLQGWPPFRASALSHRGGEFFNSYKGSGRFKNHSSCRSRGEIGTLTAVQDPTTLILVDEADRLQMNSLEQMRSIFDEGETGMVLIGMPGIEKRIARFPQFYSRIGFVHEFRPLDATEMQELLEKQWTPVGVTLPDIPLSPEVMARLIRMTGGNFRLLTRLLTQIERVLEVNELQLISIEVVEAARDSLVIGQA
jgi:DNA transposition AAA+ family ATPase